MSYAFGTVRLDPGRRQLLVDGHEQHLPPKAFDLLLALIEARPQVLTKDALMARVWPGVHVSDASLAVLVRELRQALGDSAREPRYVRTHHAVGYSFVADLLEGPAAAPPVAPGPQAWLAVGDRRIALPQGDTVVGRDAGCDVPIADVSVSRRHARLVVRGASVAVEDLGSKNGTRVRGVRIAALTPVAGTASLHFGTVMAVVSVEEAPEPSTLTVHSARSGVDR